MFADFIQAVRLMLLELFSKKASFTGSPNQLPESFDAILGPLVVSMIFGLDLIGYL